MIYTLGEGPMRLIVRDAPSIYPASGSAWFVWALWLGIAVLLLAAAATLKRRLAKPTDPYERLLHRVCESVGVSTPARTELLMHAGGDAKEALGRMMLRALQRREKETSPRT